MSSDSESTLPDLLSRSEEICIFRTLNIGKYLDDLQFSERLKRVGLCDLSPYELTVYLLQQVRSAERLIRILCEHWNLPSNITLKDLTSEDIRETLMNTPISEDLENQLRQSLEEFKGKSALYIRSKINDLARTCCLLPKEVKLLGTDVSGLREALAEEEALAIFNETEPSLESHFDGIRSRFVEATKRFVDANMGLVVARVNQEFRRNDGQFEEIWLSRGLRNREGRPVVMVDARQEGFAALLESMAGFDYRLAVNSTADRPFAAYSKKNMRHKIRTYLAKAASILIGETTFEEEARKRSVGSKVAREWDSPSHLPGPPLDPVRSDRDKTRSMHDEDVDFAATSRQQQLEHAQRLTPLEVEVLVATSPEGGRTYAQIGDDLEPKKSARQVSRIRRNALYKAQRYWGSPRDPRVFYASIPSGTLGKLCVVERLIFVSRFMQNKTLRAIIDELTNRSFDDFVRCRKCGMDNGESARKCKSCGTSTTRCPSCKSDHLSTKSPRQITSIQRRTVHTLKKHGIEVPTFR